MKIKQAFENISPIIENKYKTFLERHDNDISSELHKIYEEYAMGDVFFPRPILSLMGYSYKNEENIEQQLYTMGDIVLLPQLVRDLLAIHDDIVDEDLVKFGAPTIPFAFSNTANKIPSEIMSKKGKDLALFFGDYLYSIIFELIVDSSFENEIKLDLITLVNTTMKKTQKGQIEELLLQEKSVLDITKEEIIELYKLKAADYCYAFPFEVGLTLQKAPKSLKNSAREILLNIGSASQIIDDITGVFPEIINQDKDTFAELIYLRRTFLLVSLIKKMNSNDRLNHLVNKEKCTESEALEIKRNMLKYNILQESIEYVNSMISAIEDQINLLPIGNATKIYLVDLLQVRVKNNLDTIKKGCEQYQNTAN